MDKEKIRKAAIDLMDEREVPLPVKSFNALRRAVEDEWGGNLLEVVAVYDPCPFADEGFALVIASYDRGGTPLNEGTDWFSTHTEIWVGDWTGWEYVEIADDDANEDDLIEWVHSAEDD